MAKVSPTLKVLIEMRDEMRGMRTELTTLRGDVESLRDVVAREAAANRAAFAEIAQIFRTRRGRQDQRLDDHERRLRALERRTG